MKLGDQKKLYLGLGTPSTGIKLWWLLALKIFEEVWVLSLSENRKHLSKGISILLNSDVYQGSRD